MLVVQLSQFFLFSTSALLPVKILFTEFHNVAICVSGSQQDIEEEDSCPCGACYAIKVHRGVQIEEDQE